MKKRVYCYFSDEKLKKKFGETIEGKFFSLSFIDGFPSLYYFTMDDRPDIIVVEGRLLLREGWSFTKSIKSNDSTGNIPILCLFNSTKELSNIDFEKYYVDDCICIEWGKRYINWKFRTALKQIEMMEDASRESRDIHALLEIARIVSSSLDPVEILYMSAKKIADNIDVSRCSIISVDLSKNKAYVMASHDNPDIRGLEISIDKYPEIKKALITGEVVIIENVSRDPLLEKVRKQLLMLKIKSILVVPIIFGMEVIGTLILKAYKKKRKFIEREVRFCQAVASICAGALKKAVEHQILKDAFLKESREKKYLEKRLLMSKESRFLFENASDPLITVNENGSIVHINKKFRNFVGYNIKELRGVSFLEFISEDSRERINDLMELFSLEKGTRSTEAIIQTKKKELKWVYINASLIPGKKKLAMLSFRDISKEKSLAEGLKRTTELLRKANERLRELTIIDSLTGLYNHRYFYERLNDEFKRAMRYKHSLSCIMVDLDDFKKVNDIFGHQAGDAVLKEISMIIKNQLREVDILARYGGDEFIILLPHTELKEAEIVAERIKSRLQNDTFLIGRKGVSITSSIGISVYPHENVQSSADLVREADHALYIAKSRGGNTVVSIARQAT